MKHKEFYEILKNQLDQQVNEEDKNIELAASYCSDSIASDRLIHVFGCGHSQMFAMEVFYRAGGIVPVNALLVPHLALFPKAKLSTIQERVEGFSKNYLNLCNVDKKDTMIIVSVSGRNSAVVDMALAAKEIGMKVIALTSKQFSNGVTSRHSSGKKLIDVADVVIDIKCVEGDACLTHEQMQDKFTGTSTILGMTIMDMIMARTIELSIEKGKVPPVYVSSNLDKGDAINAEYINKYSDLIDCL
ncbi:SIS domain-containing protein [Anaerorhabdus sp.]|uniref:SIS domain-containing protein n=1 Tax=Anaerorhabdus sp. TaxID=1872524 RepID=UPI002FC613C5